MDGKQLVKQDSRSSDDTQHSPRNLILTSLQETGFIEYMDQGPWYLAFYNDGKKMEQVFVLTTAIGKLPWLWFWIDSIAPERHSDESDTDVIEAYCSFCLKVITQDTSQWDRFTLLLSVLLFKCRLRWENIKIRSIIIVIIVPPGEKAHIARILVVSLILKFQLKQSSKAVECRTS